MRLVGALMCLGILVVGSPAAGKTATPSPCPITTDLLATLVPPKDPKQAHASKLDGYVGTTDAILLSAAELNGYIDGDPKLTFASGTQVFSSEVAACLRSFARIYALAQTKENGGTVAKGLVIRLIGHADATGDEEKNFRLSYLRAEHGKAQLSKALSESKAVALPTFVLEGHGGADLWWCGIEGGTADTKGRSCRAFGGGPAALDPKLKQRNDRHLEIRVEGPLIAGPSLDRLREKHFKDKPDPQLERLAVFESRLRYFPAGTTPLAPVQIALGDVTGTKDGKANACWKTATGWSDNLWLHVGPWKGDKGDQLDLSKLELSRLKSPRKGERFDEAQLYVRIRPIPVIAGKNVRTIRLVAELATGTVGPLVATGSEPTMAFFMQSQGLTEDKPAAVAPPAALRRSLGLGVPDYWRIRLRIEQGIEDWMGGDRTSEVADEATWQTESKTVKVATLPSVSLAPCLALLFDKDEAANRPARLKRLAAVRILAGVPRDFDGLLGTTYDFNRKVRMFGLRPGNKLQLDFGQLSLLRGKSVDETISLAGGQKTYDLFAAPLAFKTIQSIAGAPDIDPGSTARAGLDAHLAVALNPMLQGIWSGKSKSGDKEALPKPTVSNPGAVINLANPYALERFMRGRIVNVFLPDLAAMTEATITKDIAADSLRDPIFVAANSPADMAALFRSFGTSAKLAGDGESFLCSKLPVPATADWRMLCGFMRSDVAPSLLITATLRSASRTVPLDTRMGSLLSSEALAPCFTATLADDKGEYEPFAPIDRLTSTISITGLGPFAPPRLYDGRDCRMLSLPILGGSDLKW